MPLERTAADGGRWPGSGQAPSVCRGAEPHSPSRKRLADRLARELATETKESLTEAVTIALRERLDRVRGDRRRFMTEALNRLADELLPALRG